MIVINDLFQLAAFTGTFQGVIDVICEWGSLFVITMENKVTSYKTQQKMFPTWHLLLEHMKMLFIYSFLEICFKLNDFCKEMDVRQTVCAHNVNFFVKIMNFKHLYFLQFAVELYETSHSFC